VWFGYAYTYYRKRSSGLQPLHIRTPEVLNLRSANPNEYHRTLEHPTVIMGRYSLLYTLLAPRSFNSWGHTIRCYAFRLRGMSNNPNLPNVSLGRFMPTLYALFTRALAARLRMSIRPEWPSRMQHAYTYTYNPKRVNYFFYPGIFSCVSYIVQNFWCVYPLPLETLRSVEDIVGLGFYIHIKIAIWSYPAEVENFL
jgi:hypothetical protein